MKTIAEMTKTVENFLMNNGFEKDNKKNVYYLAGKMSITTETRYNVFTQKEDTYEIYNGIGISITEVYRSNGTEANQSVSISVERLEGSSTRPMFREKLNSKHGEKKTATILANILKAYNEAN